MAMQKCGIYSITHVASGKLYVGQSSKMRDRWLYHRSALRRGVHSNRPLQNAWDKHGEAAFAFAMLELVALDDALLCEREQRWIDALRPAYNVAPVAGTTRGMKHPPRSAEFREKMSRLHKGRKHSPESIERMRQIPGRPHTAEARSKISKALTGLTKTPEQIEKHRLAMIGRKQSPEEIAKRVASNTGRKRTPEQCARIVAAKKAGYAARLARGEGPYKSPMKGRTHTAEAKRQISEAKRGVSSGRGQLLPEQVREIRRINIETGLGYRSIAKKLSITPGAARSVLSRLAYLWVA